MTDFLPSPRDLSDCPQLAMLTMLQMALRLAERVLVAEYPALCEGPPYCEAQSAQDAYVEAIYHQMHALDDTLEAYRHSLLQNSIPGCSQREESNSLPF
jgi:hypothetical protein